jgi:hypothetical protein
MIRCTVGFSVDDSHASMQALIRALGPALTAQPERGLACEIDCHSCKFLGPYAAAVLAGVHRRLDVAGAKPSVQLPMEPPALWAFCAFSGLRHLFLGEPLPGAEHPQAETVPVTFFSRASWTLPDPLIRLIRRHTELSADLEENLRICVNEVVQNIEDHSRSPIGGVYCASFVGAKECVLIGLVDFGRGTPGDAGRALPGSEDLRRCSPAGPYRGVFEQDTGEQPRARSLEPRQCRPVLERRTLDFLGQRCR